MSSVTKNDSFFGWTILFVMLSSIKNVSIFYKDMRIFYYAEKEESLWYLCLKLIWNKFFQIKTVFLTLIPPTRIIIALHHYLPLLAESANESFICQMMTWSRTMGVWEDFFSSGPQKFSFFKSKSFSFWTQGD